MTDPDYTKDSQVYLFEEAALRGWAVEIPKYAETDEADTPISAIRHHACGHLRADHWKNDERRADRASRRAERNAEL